MTVLAVVIIVAASLITAPLGAVAVLIWAQLSHVPWRELGFVKPGLKALLFAAAIGVALKLLLKAIVMPLLGAPPVNAHYQYLAHNPRAAIPFAIFSIILGAGIGEEILFRGYLFERFRAWLGDKRSTLIVSVIVSTVLFSLAHVGDQGVAGAEQAAFTGFVFSVMYALTRQIIPVMVAHAVYDLTALALIYFGIQL